MDRVQDFAGCLYESSDASTQGTFISKPERDSQRLRRSSRHPVSLFLLLYVFSWLWTCLEFLLVNLVLTHFYFPILFCKWIPRVFLFHALLCVWPIQMVLKFLVGMGMITPILVYLFMTLMFKQQFAIYAGIGNVNMQHQPVVRLPWRQNYHCCKFVVWGQGRELYFAGNF